MLLDATYSSIIDISAQSAAADEEPTLANTELPTDVQRTHPSVSDFRDSRGGFKSIRSPKRRHRAPAGLRAPHADDCTSDQQAVQELIRGAFIESREYRGNWSAPMDRTSLSQCPLFIVANQVHAELDEAPSTRLPDLSIFKENEIHVLYERLLARIGQLHTAYTGLLSHLNSEFAISIETESLLRQCFFLHHNLAQQFEMLGMDRCALHTREVESKLALMPPVHKQYPLEELSEDASQQVQFIWTSPFLLLQLITTYQLHMAKHMLPIPTDSWSLTVK